MESFSLLMQGFETALLPGNLLAVLAGVVIGQIIGALPGIGPAAGMALLLPLTFGMPPVTAVVMLAGIMYGGMYGGTLTSVLINVPGEAASVMTAVDGYQLAKQGRAGAALSVAAIGSFIAGTGAVVVLAISVVALSSFALRFNAPEFFLLALLGITTSASLGEGSAVKALLVAAFGLLISFVGTDPIMGTQRLTFGDDHLLEGFDFLPVAIGIFGIAEVLVSLERLSDDKPIETKLRDMWLTAKDWTDTRMAMVRGGVIGFLVGLMPGPGPAVAAIVAYVAERRFSKEPEKFGKGSLDGLAACEVREQFGGHRRDGADAGARHSGLCLDRRADGGPHPARHPPRPDADDRAAAPGVGPDCQHVHRQHHSARAEPAAGTGVRGAVAHPLRLPGARHPRAVADRRLCRDDQHVHRRRGARLRHGRLPDDQGRPAARSLGAGAGAGAADGKLAAAGADAVRGQRDNLSRAADLGGAAGDRRGVAGLAAGQGTARAGNTAGRGCDSLDSGMPASDNPLRNSADMSSR